MRNSIISRRPWSNYRQGVLADQVALGEFAEGQGLAWCSGISGGIAPVSIRWASVPHRRPVFRQPDRVESRRALALQQSRQFERHPAAGITANLSSMDCWSDFVRLRSTSFCSQTPKRNWASAVRPPPMAMAASPLLPSIPKGTIKDTCGQWGAAAADRPNTERGVDDGVTDQP